MSVLGKKPYVNKVLESLTSDELNELLRLINTSKKELTPTVLSLYDYNRFITDDNLGVHYVTLYMDELTRTVETGYLCYSEEECALFVGDNGFDLMREYRIDPVRRTWEPVNENLTVEELRGCVADIAGGKKTDSSNFIVYTDGTMLTSTLPAIVVPKITFEQLSQIHTSISQGKNVVVSDDNGSYTVTEADNNYDGIRFMYANAYLDYYLEGNSVICEYKSFGAAASSGDGVESITYAELVAKRNARELTPGKEYRITDFVTTTTQSGTRSAGHAFDILVRAEDEGTLEENARAELHEGDTYFADCKLSAWELKYCLDNTKGRFEWANTTNGKGVIYYMKDELDNEAYYDFKNIQYQVYGDSGNNYLGMFAKSYSTSHYFVKKNQISTSRSPWVYTFADFRNIPYSDSTTIDASVTKKAGINKIGPSYISNSTLILQLPFICLYNEPKNNTIGENCSCIAACGKDINIGKECSNITIFPENTVPDIVVIGERSGSILISTNSDAMINIGIRNTNIIARMCSGFFNFGTGNSYFYLWAPTNFEAGSRCSYFEVSSSADIKLENDIQYVTLVGDNSTSGALRNIVLTSYIKGASSTNIKTITEAKGLTHLVTYYATGHEEKYI